MGGADSKPKFYDVVLHCSPAVLCHQNGKWRAEFSSTVEKFKDEKWSGVTVGVLGNFNRGKTWILHRLAECALPKDGVAAKTKGLSLKWVQSSEGGKQFRHIILNTAGTNSPIGLAAERKDKEANTKGQKGEEGGTSGLDLKDKLERRRAEKKAADEKNSKVRLALGLREKIQESALYEEFLQNLTLCLADCIIVVMNETTHLDQKELHKILGQWASLCKPDQSQTKKRRNPEVYVIHNFVRATNAAEAEELFKASTEDVYPGEVFTKKDGATVFCRDEAGYSTRHVCLMFDGNPEGKKHNDTVFSFLKACMNSFVSPTSKEKSAVELIEIFCQTSSDILRKRFLQNVKQIDVAKSSQELVFEAVREEPKSEITRMTSPIDQLFDDLEHFSPAGTAFTYQSEADKQCRVIQLEVPGVEETSIEVNIKLEESLGGYTTFEVTGKKRNAPGTEYLRKSRAVQNDAMLMPHAENPDYCNIDDDDLFDADSCRYGDFSKTFQIPVRFDETKCTVVWPNNGIMLLVFPSKKTNVSICSDHGD